MTLAALIRKGGLAQVAVAKSPGIATAIRAIPATHGGGSGGIVATVATIAVANPLSPEHQAAIRAWLTTIGEHNPVLIAETLDQCRADVGARDYFLGRAAAIPSQEVAAQEAAYEATEERAAILEYDGGLTRSEADRVAQLAGAFYNHIMGPGAATGCCHAPVNRYCLEGKRLRGVYYEAAKAAGRLT